MNKIFEALRKCSESKDNDKKTVVKEYLEDGWDYGDDELASIYGGDTGYDYEEEPETDIFELNNLSAMCCEDKDNKKRILTVDRIHYSRFMNDTAKKMVDEFNTSNETLKLDVYPHYVDASLEDILEEGMYDYVSDNKELVEMLYELNDAASPVGWDVEDIIEDTAATKVTESIETSSPEAELERLGVDLSRAEKDGEHSYFNVTVSTRDLKEKGYKRIHTTSNDDTSSVYTNGTWVINLVACTGGYVSIYKLGPEAKKTIDAGETFDVFNKSLDESYKEPINYIMVEYSYNGDAISDYKGHVRVRTDDENKALKAASKYAMAKHPEDEPRHFAVTSDTYTNVDVIDSDGDYLTTLNESAETESVEEKFEIVNLTVASDLDKLYKQSALTLEGLAVDSIGDFVEWLEDLGAVESYPLKVYTISGSVMNDVYQLTGNNSYPENLTIVSVMDINQAKVTIPRFQIGGRWFDDIVDNNARREGSFEE